MTFEFPADLIRLQTDWLTTGTARTAAAKSGDDEAFEAAHARLQYLTMGLHRHEWLRKYVTPVQACAALREAARVTARDRWQDEPP